MLSQKQANEEFVSLLQENASLLRLDDQVDDASVCTLSLSMSEIEDEEWMIHLRRVAQVAPEP